MSTIGNAYRLAAQFVSHAIALTTRTLARVLTDLMSSTRLRTDGSTKLASLWIQAIAVIAQTSAIQKTASICTANRACFDTFSAIVANVLIETNTVAGRATRTIQTVTGRCL